MSRTCCPMCEPYYHGDHEFIRWRVCLPHERQLERDAERHRTVALDMKDDNTRPAGGKP